MVRVTIRRDYVKASFEFKDFDVAANFTNLALNSATDEIKVEIEKVAEPAQEPQEESRFINPEELTEVPPEELAKAEEFF